MATVVCLQMQETWSTMPMNAQNSPTKSKTKHAQVHLLTKLFQLGLNAAL